MIKPSQVINIGFTTQNINGNSANADSLPTGILVQNGVDTATTVTITNKSTGSYNAQFTIPAAANGVLFELRIEATVATVSGKMIVWEDTVYSTVDANVTKVSGTDIELATSMDANVVAVNSDPVTSVNDFKADVSGALTTFGAAKTTDVTSAVSSINTQVNTRLAASSYVAPDNAGITSIKRKTDYLLDSAEVLAGGYPTIATGANNVSSGYYEFFPVGPMSRIRQDGAVCKIRLYSGSTSNVTKMQVRFWRQRGTTLVFDLVGATEDFYTKLVAGSIVSVTLDKPVAGVKTGDYYSLVVNTSGGNSQRYSTVTGNKLYYKSGGAFTDTGATVADLTSEFPFDNSSIPVEFYMLEQPTLVAFGDSLISGTPGTTSFCWPSTYEFSRGKEIGFQVASSIFPGEPYQNLGISGNTTGYMVSVLQHDLLNTRPRYALLNGGINDIALGTVNESTFITNWTTILDTCRNNGICPIVMSIAPATGMTNTQMATAKTWNTSLQALVATYPGARFIDLFPILGQDRAGQPAGNLYDLKPEYNADGLHWTAAGYTAAAHAISVLMRAEPDNASITAIKGKTDTLTFNGTNINANITQVAAGNVSSVNDFKSTSTSINGAQLQANVVTALTTYDVAKKSDVTIVGGGGSGMSAGQLQANVVTALTTYGTSKTSDVTTAVSTINTQVNTRMASFTYIAPDNAAIAAIKAKTDNLPDDPASNTQVNTRMASFVYTAPNNAAIAAIQAKTDNLPNDPASNTQVNTRMASFTYTAPDNAAIAAIRGKTDLLTFVGTDVVSTLNGETVTMAGYVAPDNTGIAAIRAKTDNLPSDPASNTNVNTRMPASSYVAPDNDSIASIKNKTDQLTFIGGDVVSTLNGETVVASNMVNLTTITENIAKVLAAIYDPCTVSGNTITLSNGVRMTITETGRVLS